MSARACLAALLLAACEHPRPFVADVARPGPPPGDFPLRVTFNPEGDWNPVYTADGTRIMFSWAVPGRADRDRCLVWMPAAGGTITSELCWKSPADEDSVDVIVTAAESPGGRLAFVADRGGASSSYTSARALLVSPPGEPWRATLALTFPASPPGAAAVWFGARDLTWIDDSTLAFTALYYAHLPGSPPPGVPPDTVITGVEVVRLNLRPNPPAVRVYPGTRYASSVGPGPAPGVVVFTLGGDSVVYTLNLATGVVAPLYDFGALGIARDARVVAGGRLVAIVGGKVSYGFDNTYQLGVQRDGGGVVYAVDLPGGAPRQVAPDFLSLGTRRLFRHVSALPGGAVAEGYLATIVPVPCDCPAQDTVVSRSSDLFLIALPPLP